MKYWVAILFIVSSSFLLSSTSVFAAPITAGSFSTTWKTDNPGTTATNQIRIPTTGAGYNYNIYWENVASSTQNGTLTGRTGATTITFPAIGTYRVDITGSFPRIYFNGGGDRQKILTVEQWGNIAWTSMADAFEGASNLQVPATDTPNLAAVTSMTDMFLGASSLNQPLDGWDVSNVTTFLRIFFNASSFNQSLSSWNISPTATISYMFSGTAFNQDFTTWPWLYDPARTSWAGLLSGANAFNQDMTNLVIPSHITDVSVFLSGNNTFNQDIAGWDVSHVTDFSGMFDSATAFNQPLNNWDVSSATDLSEMFFRATSFNQPLDQWDVSNVFTFESMFYEAAAFNQPLNSWNTSGLTNSSYMFYFAPSFNQPLDNWDMSGVTNMSSMFEEATAFNQDLSNWNLISLASGTFDGPYNMFLNSALDTANYSSTLTGWSQSADSSSALGTVGQSANPTPYCSTVQAARDIFVTTYSWIITDGGSTPCYVVTYTPGLNATLIGQGTQTIVDGEDSTEVEVVPDAGFRFVKWSDESTQNPRTDSAVGANLTVSAIIEADPSGGGSTGTRVGVRAQNQDNLTSIPTTTTTSTPAITTTDALLDSVAALIDRMRGNEQELKNLPSEEKQKLIALLQAVVVQLLALLASL